ncbi:MAG: TonB-dependent receptor, partial [Candidatus Aenigmarchaeota archaeon]|nr:TonB-dependent receptor [Candidatus Aenigmarchaeota archaeon]
HWELSFRKRKPSEHYEGESFGVPFTFDSKRDSDTIGVTPRYILEKTIWGKRNKFITGLDYYLTGLELESDYFSSGYQTMDSIDFKRRSWGIYANDEISIHKNFVLTMGIRHEGCKYEFDSTNTDITFGTVSSTRDEIREGENAYNAGLTFLYREKSSIFTRYSRSFRFPLADEYFVFYPPPGGINRELRAQTGDNYEIGVTHYFTPDIDLGLTLFLMNLDDEIFFNPFTYANENYDKTRHQGIELSFHAKIFEGLDIDANYSFTSSKFRGGEFDGNVIPAVPRHKGSIGILFTLIPNLVLNVSGSYVGKSYLISDQQNQFPKLDDYTTVDARLSNTWKGLTAFIAGNNLLNKEYSAYGVVYGGESYFYPSPERNFIGGFSYIYQM